MKITHVLASAAAAGLSVILFLTAGCDNGKTGSTSNGSRKDGASPAVATSAFVQHVQSAGKMVVGAANSEGNNIKDVKSDEWIGPYPALARYIGKKLGVKVVFEDAEFSTIVAGLQGGKYDATTGIGASPERAQAVRFAKGIRPVIAVLIVRKDRNPPKTFNEGLTPDKIVCPGQSSVYLNALKKGGSQAQISQLDGITQCLAALQAGKVDSVYWTWITGGLVCAKDPNIGLLFPEGELVNLPVAMAFNKKYTEADLEPINQIIDEYIADRGADGYRAALNAIGGYANPLDCAIGPVPEYAKVAAKIAFPQ